MSPLGPSRGVEKLGEVSAEYERTALAYAPVATAAAVAEAAHKTAKAKFMLKARADGDCRSIAEAETRADADDEIADLLMTRLTTRAVADSHLERLRQLRTRVEVGRSYVASEREADRYHVNGYTGAA